MQKEWRQEAWPFLLRRIVVFATLVGSLIYGQLGSVVADASEDKINAVYASLHGIFPPSDVGDSMMYLEMDFNKSIPEQDQANVLAELIERAAKAPEDLKVLFNAMHLVHLKQQDGTSQWNARLGSGTVSITLS